MMSLGRIRSNLGQLRCEQNESVPRHPNAYIGLCASAAINDRIPKSEPVRRPKSVCAIVIVALPLLCGIHSRPLECHSNGNMFCSLVLNNRHPACPQLVGLHRDGREGAKLRTSRDRSLGLAILFECDLLAGCSPALGRHRRIVGELAELVCKLDQETVYCGVILTTRGGGFGKLLCKANLMLAMLAHAGRTPIASELGHFQIDLDRWQAH